MIRVFVIRMRKICILGNQKFVQWGLWSDCARFGRTAKVRFLTLHFSWIWASPCENVSLDICGQRRPWSDCASAQSNQGLHCPLIELLDTTEFKNGEQRSERYFAHMQDDVIPYILRMLRVAFSLGAVHMMNVCVNMLLLLLLKKWPFSNQSADNPGLSLSVVWKNGPERGLKTVSFNS